MPDTGDSLTPDSVRVMHEERAAFISGAFGDNTPKPSTRTTLDASTAENALFEYGGKQLVPVEDLRFNTTVAPALSKEDAKALDILHSMSPGARRMFLAQDSASMSLMEWQAYVGKGSADNKLTMWYNGFGVTVPFVSRVEPHPELVVFLLPVGAADITLGVSSRISYKTGASEPVLPGIFFTCFVLPSFPYRFLILGRDADENTVGDQLA